MDFNSLHERKASLVSELKNARKNKLGATNVVGIVVTLIVVIIVLVFGAVIMFLFFNQATAIGGLSAAQKGNVTLIMNNGNGVLQLASLLPYALIIGAVISILLGIFAVRRTQG